MARKTLHEALGKVQRVHQHQLYYDNHTEAVVGGGRKRDYSQSMIPDRQMEAGRLMGSYKRLKSKLRTHLYATVRLPSTFSYHHTFKAFYRSVFVLLKKAV